MPLPTIVAISPPPLVDLEPMSLVTGAQGPVAAVLWILLAASFGAVAITVIKVRQLHRWTIAEEALEGALLDRSARLDLLTLADEHGLAPGAAVVRALGVAQASGEVDPELLGAAAARAQVDVRRRVSTMMTTLASIGSTAPFIGLFGTVYGIMEAFLRISQATSATLPVVAPAIGEALIATAVGLFAAIPAVLAFNALSQRLDHLEAALGASAKRWILLTREESGAALAEEVGS